ncbi:alpha/beta hydrolase [Gloeocapsa sp. PCC 73106]|uniref:alpha/beta hydrolase n=1 Tax=Gloeocapsa sp. PCC 73106 TaxID=102232 RepID=UPI0002ABD091|nr:alpha/beta hydrolase [Gloeocapsa sp. PCC 73106]ELR98329.1 putative dienelactone hydrolase [Gloeocapsa sp. PCC 73106]
MFKSKILLFFGGLLLVCLTSIPIRAAEKLFLSYGPLKFSLRVESLESFAKDGTINRDLAFYLNRATPEQQKEFREALTKRIAIDPVLVSRFLNSTMGESILMRLGKGITLEGGSNGGYALRGAIVQASFDPEGLTLLKVLQKFPTNLQFQGELIAILAEETETLILATQTLVETMRTWTAAEAEANPLVNYADLADLRQVGPYQVKRQVWHLKDLSRERSFYVDVYIPQKVSSEKIPVAIFSHGLSSRPEDYSDGLNHLASYGYLIAAPQHVGSDLIYLQKMFQGYHRDIFEGDEFINRPRDISFVIDELERRNQSEFAGKLDLENVGVGGHSFGGYTALAIAGAEIDFDYLKQACERLGGGLSVSLLLQCRALELSRENYQFRDNRVQAVLAANPVNRYIFGETGLAKINIPTILFSGSKDPAAPPALEQGLPFSWLTIPDKYWALIEGQAHVNFTKLDGGMQEAINAMNHLVLPSQTLISSYSDAMSLAFFEVHIRQNEEFLPYLQSAYAQYLSQNQRFKLSFVTEASSEQVRAMAEEFRREHKIKIPE